MKRRGAKEKERSVWLAYGGERDGRRVEGRERETEKEKVRVVG